MKTVRTRAIVLRRTNYGEADRIIQLLTPLGRRSVMARGVRREKSKLAGGIELFAICDVVIGEGRGQLGVLTSARLVHFYHHILKDYDRTHTAYEVLSEITKASESLDDSGWYDIASDVLMALDVNTVPLALVQAWFYLRMSSMMGEELNTARDASGELLVPENCYRYDSSDKIFIPTQNGDITAEHIKILRLLAANPLSALVQIGGMNAYLPDVLYVARQHASL
ncbi:MAG: DNA repair protein RecO [Candidatus Saccharimonadales bacterium]